NGKKHLYLISSDARLLDILKQLEGEFLISSDSSGELLKTLNAPSDTPEIDLVITGFDYFVNEVNEVYSENDAFNLPYFLVLVTPEQATRCAAEKFSVKCYPVFLPVDASQIRTLAASVIQNHEKAAELSEMQRYKILFHKAPVVHLLVNPCNLQILDANRAAADLYGQENSESLLGKSLLDLHPGQSDLINKKCREALKIGEKNFNCLYDSGKDESVELVFFASKIELGKRNFLFLNIQDITETKKTEKILTQKNLELHKTNAELDHFVYSTSHELRAPLMSVLGLISLLEAEADATEQALYLGLMKESIGKLDLIIHDIIDYSRNARFEVKLSPIDFNFLLEKTINNLNYISGSERIDIRIKVRDEGQFMSDKRRVEIILSNLLSNSLKFCNPQESKPFVEVEIHTTPGQALIRVNDNGRGIPAPHLPRIFEMFFRGYEQSTGSGIGLYIVREIIEKLNGTIEVKSEEGKGSAFTVKLPNQYQPL
ncbi:MAG: ATP-binding protein, partial [Bacteroides sp.]|nr:ATP-binding protein [Bacteroides sp.]